jgi:predicted TIM-barrel fold metal-dependent hydrolase
MNLKEQIDNIRIIDDHVHALSYVYWRDVVGDKPFAFELNKLDVPSKMTTIAHANTLAAAYCELYDFPYPTITPDNEPELDKLYQRSKKDEASVCHRAMEKAGIDCAFEICPSNPELPPGLNPQLFRRIPCLDGLIIPLNNTELKKASRQTNAFLLMAESFAKGMHKQLNWYPKLFDDYLKFISVAIEKLREQGCIALKLNHAYWRDIKVGAISEDEARDVFKSKDASPICYKHLQDFLIRRIMVKSAELDMPIQIHTGGIGQERSMREGDPSCLDGFLWLPDLRQAKVVLLHGGYPFCQEAGFMVSRMWSQRRTCLDISWMWWGHFSSPNALVGILREWLEMGIVRRLIYGSDARNPHQLWMSAKNIRKALYLALTGMMNDGLIDENQALFMAELILFGNAKTLYKL